LSVPISAIREIRLRQPPTESEDIHASRWLTIVYVQTTQWRVLHLIALTDDVYTLWTDTLTRQVAETSDKFVSQVPAPADPDMMWIRQLWPHGAKSIDFATAAGLCGGIGLVIPPENAEKNTVSG
jgi:phosphatidylinositol phospholipase C delta